MPRTAIIPRPEGRYAAAGALTLALLLAGCGGVAPRGPDDVRSSGQSAETLMRVAEDTRAGGDLGTSVTLYRRIHELRPDDPEPLVRLAAVLAQLQAYSEAAAAYRAAEALDPEDPEIRRGLATVLLSLDQPEPAIVELQAALARRPTDPRLYNALGVANDLMGRHDVAQEAYRNGLHQAPEHRGLRNNYGLSLALAGDYRGAIAALTELVARPDVPPRYRLNLALVYGLAGDEQKAAAAARPVLDEEAVRSNLAYYALLRAMDDKGRAAAIIGSQVRGALPAEAAAIAAAPAAETPLAAPTAPVQTASLPPVAASPPVPPDETAPVPITPAKAAPARAVEQAPPPSAPSAAKAAAPAPGRFTVQLGAFSAETNAQHLADQVAAKGYDVRVVRDHDRAGREWVTVRTGDFASHDEAEQTARRLRETMTVPAMVVRRPIAAPSTVAAAEGRDP